MGTGYSAARAAEHDALVRELVAYSNRHGFPARELPVDGWGPDFEQRRPDGHPFRFDVKTDGGKRIDVACRSYWAAMNSSIPTFFIDAKNTPAGIVAIAYDPHLLVRWIDPKEGAGPFPPNGNGSRTDYYLFQKSGGTSFAKFCEVRWSTA